MYCKFCGKEIPAEARFCPHCGREQASEANGPQAAGPGVPGQNGNSGYGAPNGYGVPPNNVYGTSNNGYGAPPNVPPYYPPYRADTAGGGWIALGFFFPLVGLILFLVWQTELPNRAKACGKGALIGVIVAVALWVLAFILLLCMTAIFAISAPMYFIVSRRETISPADGVTAKS